MYPEALHIEDDAYGPGADLMISLFAIALLLLSIVGVNGSYDRIVSKIEQSNLVARALSEQAMNGPIPLALAPIEQLNEARASLQASKDDLRRLEKEIQAAERTAAAVLDAKKLSDAENARLAEENARAANEMRQAEAALASLNARAQGLEKSLLEAERLRDEQLAEIEKGRATIAERDMLLRDAGLQLSELQLRPNTVFVELLEYAPSLAILADALKQGQFPPQSLSARALEKLATIGADFPSDLNLVVIDSFVPPELLGTFGNDEDPSAALRALYRLSASAADSYASALFDVGVPLACITIRAHAYEDHAGVRDDAAALDAGTRDTIAGYMTYYRNLGNQQGEAQPGLVRIRLEADPESRCTATVLRSAFAKADTNVQ